MVTRTDSRGRALGAPDRLCGPSAERVTLPEVIETIIKATWEAPDAATPALKSIQRVTRREALDAMMMLGGNAAATPTCAHLCCSASVGLGINSRVRLTPPIRWRLRCTRRRGGHSPLPGRIRPRTRRSHRPCRNRLEHRLECVRGNRSRSLRSLLGSAASGGSRGSAAFAAS